MASLASRRKYRGRVKKTVRRGRKHTKRSRKSRVSRRRHTRKQRGGRYGDMGCIDNCILRKTGFNVNQWRKDGSQGSLPPSFYDHISDCVDECDYKVDPEL